VTEPAEDATRRTRLANERTFLAWLRTGVTCLAAGLAVGRVLPELIEEGTTWPYAAIGAGWALVGMALVGYGLRRERSVAAALDRGDFEPIEGSVLVGLTGAAFLLGAGTLALVVLQA
jgi:putative membrane protein